MSPHFSFHLFARVIGVLFAAATLSPYYCLFKEGPKQQFRHSPGHLVLRSGIVFPVVFAVVSTFLAQFVHSHANLVSSPLLYCGGEAALSASICFGTKQFCAWQANVCKTSYAGHWRRAGNCFLFPPAAVGPRQLSFDRRVTQKMFCDSHRFAKCFQD